jgi:hypothetical protein
MLRWCHEVQFKRMLQVTGTPDRTFKIKCCDKWIRANLMLVVCYLGNKITAEFPPGIIEDEVDQEMISSESE